MQELRRIGVQILMTSRSQLGCGLQGAERLHLRSLTPEHAAALLRIEAGVTPPQARKLASICGCNALAMRVLGGAVARRAFHAEVRICIALQREQSRLDQVLLCPCGSCSTSTRCDVARPNIGCPPSIASQACSMLCAGGNQVRRQCGLRPHWC